MSEKLNIHQKICEIMRGMPMVAKSQYNKHNDYKFAGRDDIVKEVRKALVEQGIVFRLSHLEDSRYQADYIDIDNPDDALSLVIEAVGVMDGQRHTPQSYGAVISYAEKYAHRTVFQIETGDPDSDSGPLDGGKDDRKEKCAALCKELGISKEEKADMWAMAGHDLDAMIQMLEEKKKENG